MQIERERTKLRVCPLVIWAKVGVHWRLRCGGRGGGGEREGEREREREMWGEVLFKTFVERKASFSDQELFAFQVYFPHLLSRSCTDYPFARTHLR